MANDSRTRVMILLKSGTGMQIDTPDVKKAVLLDLEAAQENNTLFRIDTRGESNQTKGEVLYINLDSVITISVSDLIASSIIIPQKPELAKV